MNPRQSSRVPAAAFAFLACVLLGCTGCQALPPAIAAPAIERSTLSADSRQNRVDVEIPSTDPEATPAITNGTIVNPTAPEAFD